jgi:hypothetical protein
MAMIDHPGCRCHQEWDANVTGATRGFRTGVANRDDCSLWFSREKLDRPLVRGFNSVELDNTMEAFALLPRFGSLFTAEQLRIARVRLIDAGFDVAGYVQDADNRDWTCSPDCPERRS